MIRKLKGEYRLYSRKSDPKTGKRKNLGTFKIEGGREARAGSSVLQAPLSERRFWNVRDAAGEVVFAGGYDEMIAGVDNAGGEDDILEIALVRDVR